jgi:hypothetical protein
MELVVLFIIAALLFLGPRKGGRMPSMLTIGLGLFFLLWFLVAMGFGTLWNDFFGTMPQP